MNEIGNSTILPLALWLKEPPLHRISSIIYLKKSNYIVTGSEKGHIIVWFSETSGNKLLPQYYLIGHRSKISNLVLGGSSINTYMEYFVSFSSEGEIALWEAQEGRNIEFISNSQMDIQNVFSHESQTFKQRLIFCCLKNVEIVVLNSMSLSYLCTLVCTSSPNWFSSLTAYSKINKEDVVLATTVSGNVSMWKINFTDVLNQQEQNPLIESDDYVDISTMNPFKISHNQHYSEIVMVITPSRIKVFHTKEWKVLSYLDCHRGNYFIDGDFINHDTILIHTQAGKSFYYNLPPRANFKHSVFMKDSSSICDKIPILITEFGEPENMISLREKVFTQTFIDKFVIWKGLSNGNIYKWEFVNKTNETYPIVFNLEKSWSSIRRIPTSLTKSLKHPLSNCVVTSVLMVHELSLIVLGMENGSIFIRNINDALSCAFSDNELDTNFYMSLKGHDGPVTCLIHPSSSMRLHTFVTPSSNFRLKSCLNLLKLTHILWSGGTDYTIRVWNIKTEQMITIFHCHSAPIVALKLNHLPLNATNVCGFSQGFTDAMFSSIGDAEENSNEIKKMINTCMNAFLVGIAENNGISIISVMKQKLLLYTVEHNSPVRNLGWILDSGYLLVDTIESNVYVWDLSSGTMDRVEMGEKAELLMENCNLITRIRSKLHRDERANSKLVRRHSFNGVNISKDSTNHFINHKFIRFQFIDSGSYERLVPLLIFNLSALIDSLNSYNQNPPSQAKFSIDLELPSLTDSKSFNGNKKKPASDSEISMNNVKSDHENLKLIILLMKIILSKTDFYEINSTINSASINAKNLLCSFPQVNSKTGCISFNLGPLFEDCTNETKLTIDNMLIQLSISNKIISFSKSPVFDMFLNIYTNCENKDHCLDQMLHSSLTLHSINPMYKPSITAIKSFKNQRKIILNKQVVEFLKVLNGEMNDVSFNLLEKVCNKLILGILDICDTVSKSALQLMAKIISNLTDQQIQNYILVWRLFLFPNHDFIVIEDEQNFLSKIQPYLDKFIEYSYLSADWVWWYSKDQIRSLHEKRNLSKIQIKALLNIALVGSHLQNDDSDKIAEGKPIFNKLFWLDKSFLARITCQFLMSMLFKKPKKSKSNIGRLINLSMICLSIGYLVWEPYLDSSSVFSQFLKFAGEHEDPDIEDKFLSLVSKKAIEDISSVRPIVFIMVCYREMVRLTASSNSSSYGFRKIEKRKSNATLSSLAENDSVKNENSVYILNSNILIPIFNNLCQNQSQDVLDVLPELVELYVYFYIQEEDFCSIMLPILKYSSVSLNETTGHISVGSANGNLFLFDLKFGKYFSGVAHKKAIRITKLSDDAKFVASYSSQENSIKIWQISHNKFFSGHNPYQVKLMSSHTVPSIGQMLGAINISSRHVITDHLLDKETDLLFEWDPDNRHLFIKMNSIVIKQIKL